MCLTIVLFHNYFSPSCEQTEQRISAHKSEQPTAGGIAIFHKYCCYIKHGDIVTNLTLWNLWGYENIESHTAHSIVSWPKPKQWQMGWFFLMIIRSHTGILTIIIREMGKLNTHSPIYCMKDNWENWPNLRHARDRIYLTSILAVQYLQIVLHNDDNEVV